MARRAPAGARVCVGEIGAPHGVRGLVTVSAFTEVPEDVAAYGPVETESGRKLHLTVRGAKKTGLIVAIDGIDSREAALAFKGERLHVARAHLPAAADDEWYHADLVGLAVWSEDDRPLGRVVAVHNFGAGDLLEIAPEEGASVLVPFARETVPIVDIEAGRVIVAEPERFFEPADGAEEAPG